MPTSQLPTSEDTAQTISQQAYSPSSEQQNGKPRVEKVQSYLAVVSTTLGILGAVGTAFVWLASNVCVGDVEIRPDRSLETVMVKVVDKKGQQATYFSKHVQLMPGSYHLEIGVPDKQPTWHTDVNVQLWKASVIPYAVPDNLTQSASSTDTSEPQQGSAQDVAGSEASSGKKRWWQFWRKPKESAQ
jgi:hypothetical protein